MNLQMNQTERPTMAKIFRHLRISAGLRLRNLAALLNVHHTAIVQWENGKTALSPKRIKQLCRIFHLSEQQLEEYRNGKPIPINYRDECMFLIAKMDESELQVIHMMLSKMNQS